jgi:hypothetical protein
MDENTTFEAEDIQRLDNVLEGTGMPALTRRGLLGKAAAGSLAVGALGALGPIPAALASGSQIDQIVTDAVTAEALAVTFLTGVVTNARAIGIPNDLVPVLRAANAAEYEHYKVLRSLGAKPLTKKFWAPDSFFKSSQTVFETIEYAETLFVNAYLIGITAFAKAGKSDLARYAGEIMGTECEHRALARFAQGKLPNNVGFEGYEIHSISGIVAGLEKAGIGFGEKGKGKGRFYEFHAPPHRTLHHLDINKPA